MGTAFFHSQVPIITAIRRFCCIFCPSSLRLCFEHFTSETEVNVYNIIIQFINCSIVFSDQRMCLDVTETDLLEGSLGQTALTTDTVFQMHSPINMNLAAISLDEYRRHVYVLTYSR